MQRTNAKDDAVEGGDDGERPGILLAARLLVSRAGAPQDPISPTYQQAGATPNEDREPPQFPFATFLERLRAHADLASVRVGMESTWFQRD